MNAVGGSYHFRPLPGDAATPEAWRPLDRAVARWVAIHGGSPLLAQVAGWASLAEGHGDSALPLEGTDAARHGMGALDAAALAALASEPLVQVVGDGVQARATTPFVIDRGHFYLRRNFLHEVAVAQQLVARRAVRGADVQTPAAYLAELFPDGAGPALAQREAVAGVPGQRLFVLTGGPGTGKTTTVLRMLLVLIHQRLAQGAGAPVIRIGAPTGKAAQRLSGAMREGAKGLREQAAALPPAWQASLDLALGAESGTLHRLLGSRGHGGGFRHHAGDRLPADIIVVDEASMVDLALLRVLLDALRDEAVLILVGDADQLTSVGTGSVLLDLVSVMEAAHSRDLVRLEHSFRADQSLVPINRAILHGDAAAFADAWQAAGPQVSRRVVASATDVPRALLPWCRALRELLAAAGAFGRIPVGRDDRVLAALDALRARQLLCALREGVFGATAINALIERDVRPAPDADVDAVWYPGRAVLVTRNDAAAGLFNGDVGLCLRGDDDRLRVWFEVTAPPDSDTDAVDANATSHRSVRAFAPGALPEHRGAFAVTIHKSQGSEYDHVALLLPPDADNRILSRQLLYTGASRARHALELWATDEALAAALATPIVRAGGLRQRLG